MKVFLASLIVAVILAVAANLVLTRGVQESSEVAYSSSAARP